MPTPSSLRIALAGAGRVGTAVAVLLAEAGHEIAGVWSRSDESARRARDLLGSDAIQPGSEIKADVLLVGAGDTAIEEVAATFGPSLPPGCIVWHFAGSRGVAPLAAGVGRSDLYLLAGHPVQACPSVVLGIARLPGSAWGVTCSADVRARAFSLITSSLGGVPVEVREEDRPLWHAASVMTSNGIAALLGSGEALLGAIGVVDPIGVLGPLAAGTVANAVVGGGGDATLTGPIVRGETDVVAGHLAALREVAPHLADTYEGIAWMILAAASRARRIEEPVAAEIGAALEAR
ncbi:MAG TPA: DUF2520 domain-containing protein [Actinomycetota bacterium]|nr:DUF2520 domain-containing protein [Actinomycetota bacterium]